MAAIPATGTGGPPRVLWMAAMDRHGRRRGTPTCLPRRRRHPGTDADRPSGRTCERNGRDVEAPPGERATDPGAFCRPPGEVASV